MSNQLGKSLWNIADDLRGTYNLARMNMQLHGKKDTGFAIFHGDTLENS